MSYFKLNFQIYNINKRIMRYREIQRSLIHLTLNQQVPGSTPGRPTSKIKRLLLIG